MINNPHLFTVFLIWSLSDVVATKNPRVQKRKKKYTSPEYYRLIFSEELVHILNQILAKNWSVKFQGKKVYYQLKIGQNYRDFCCLRASYWLNSKKYFILLGSIKIMNMIAYKNILKFQQESQILRSHVSHANVACQMGHAVSWVWGGHRNKIFV